MAPSRAAATTVKSARPTPAAPASTNASNPTPTSAESVNWYTSELPV